MLRRVDRIILRVPQVESAAKYYERVLGLKVGRRESGLVSFELGDGGTELVLHDKADGAYEEVYYLVDDVREMYRRREELTLKFAGPPTAVARGWRATVKDPFGNVLLLLDRSAEGKKQGAAGAGGVIEDGRAPDALFAGVEKRVGIKTDLLVGLYEKVARTADDLPYTPHFESLYKGYVQGLAEAEPPTRGEVWRHLLNLRKRGGVLPKLGEARSKAPVVGEEERERLKGLVGTDLGKRDRLPYTERFDQIVDEFNRGRGKGRSLSPHLVWRLVATLAK